MVLTRMPSASHRDRFYDIMALLRRRCGERRLADCHGRMAWPRQGVYFFFEPGEVRGDGVSPRCVRVGTHAVAAGAKTTLWNRLSQHRGTLKGGGGNHRGSIFRLHVGSALLARRDDLGCELQAWLQGNNAPSGVKARESVAEQAVSAHIRAMPFLWVAAADDAGKHSIRAVIERNAIALLSQCGQHDGDGVDVPSAGWLGRVCAHPAVQASGLWNVRHVSDGYDPAFLDVLEQCAAGTGSVGGGS